MPRSVGLARLWHLTPLIALAATIGLLALGILIVYSGERTYREQQADELKVDARILASTMVAALSFEDRAVADIYVRAVEADPEVQAAVVYDAAGKPFVEYRRSERIDVPASAPSEPRIWQDDHIAVTVPVTREHSLIGSVYVRGVLEPLSYRLERYGMIGLLVVMAMLLTAVLGIAQIISGRTNRALAEANAGLESQIARREQVEEALRQAQKMEAIGQLTGGVAHDFNNILQVILGNLGSLQLHIERGRTADVDALLRPVKTAIAGGERAAVLVSQLLAFSRRQPLQPRQIEVNRLIGGMSDLLHRALGETVEVETVLGARVWSVLADPNQLESALLNLAVNARDAMPDGGKLTIETGNAFIDEVYAATEEGVEPGQYVAIAVSDSGEGMSKDVIAKAFDPFFTTKGIGQGTGLGLSQVYGFIKQSGGHAKIYSEPGQGTTIKLYLPRIAAASQSEAEPADDTRLVRGDREVILVVEDEEEVRRLVVDTLSELGYEVMEAGTGPDALRLIDARSDIRLIFTDVGLPGGMTGRQLADRALERRPGLRVLFTTGYARNAIVHQGRLDPGVDLLVKPFTNAALAARIREVLSDAEAGRAL